jgi:hypothetical protein
VRPYPLRGDEEFLIFSKAAEAEETPNDARLSDMIRRAVGADILMTMLDHRP